MDFAGCMRRPLVLEHPARSAARITHSNRHGERALTHEGQPFGMMHPASRSQLLRLRLEEL